MINYLINYLLFKMLLLYKAAGNLGSCVKTEDFSFVLFS